MGCQHGKDAPCDLYGFQERRVDREEFEQLDVTPLVPRLRSVAFKNADALVDEDSGALQCEEDDCGRGDSETLSTTAESRFTVSDSQTTFDEHSITLSETMNAWRLVEEEFRRQRDFEPDVCFGACPDTAAVTWDNVAAEIRRQRTLIMDESFGTDWKRVDDKFLRDSVCKAPTPTSPPRLLGRCRTRICTVDHDTLSI